MRRNLGIFPSFFYPSHFSFKTAMACSPKEQTAETPPPASTSMRALAPLHL